MKIRKAVIPAAGYGTRFLPVTKALAKEMLPIVDTPAIQYIVEEALNSGIEEFIIIISSNKNSIMDYFDRNLELEGFLKEKGKESDLKLVRDIPSKVNIHFIRQKEQLGLGHAVLCAKTFVGNEPFAVLLGDDVYVGKDEPTLKQMINAYEQVGGSIVGTIEVPLEDTKKYGICDLEVGEENKRVQKLKGVIEKPHDNPPSRLAIGGRYILSPRIFELLETQERGVGNEIQLTDSIKRLMESEEVYSCKLEGKRYDIGSKIGFIEATIDFALERPYLREQVIELLKNKKIEL